MSHSPPQGHREVHFNAAFLHLHHPDCTHSEAILWMRHLTQVVWSTVVSSGWIPSYQDLACINFLMSCGVMHKTSLLFVVTTCLVTTICDICFTKKENSYLLVAFICSNCCQLPCRLATLLIIAFPSLLLVCDFKLFSWYWSQTMSTRRIVATE